jgi:hypothetical protein
MGKMKSFGQSRRLSPESVKNLPASYIYILQYYIITIQQKQPKNLGAMPIPFVKNPKPVFLHNSHFYYKAPKRSLVSTRLFNVATLPLSDDR